MKKRVARKTKFPRLRQLREDLGWEVMDIVAKVAGKPSVASIYRLEQGQALRVSHTRRVFDVINEAHGGKLDAKKELKEE